MTAYLLHNCADRLRVISNGGRESPPAKPPGEPGERQAGKQAGRQAGHQATSQAGRQPGKQASRQGGKQANRQQGRGKLPAEGDLGQFLKLGKNPLCLAAYLGNE